jgi:hypothetical protein
MLHIVIPLHPGGGKDKTNEELRFALRSWEANMREPFDVTIIGKRIPAWLTGVTHIKQGAPAGLKQALKTAAATYPEGFLWAYDDTFLIKPSTAEEAKVPVAKPSFGQQDQTGWNKMLMQIHGRLVSEGIPPLDVSRPHCPYWFDKSMVDEGFRDWPGMTAKFPWETWIISKRRVPVRVGIEKQYYGKNFGGPPEPHHVYINCSDAGWTPKLKGCLLAAFPRPSRFEKADVEIPTTRDLIFIHVPKTGGTSIRDALGFNLRVNNTSHFNSNHPEVKKMRGPDTLMFAVVRNPYDRAWSAFKFFAKAKKSRGRIERVFEIFMSTMDVNDFWCKVDIEKLARVMPHVRTQSSFIRDPMRLLRFERLDEDWKEFAAEIGRPELELPRKQVSPGVPWQEALSEESKARIRQIYKIDFEKFGYET